MGTFTNSTYNDTLLSLVNATESKINNPYYKFSDKKPTEVVYYRQNKEKSTLDPDSGTNYQHVGDYSPIKFDKIVSFLLYGMGRIELNYDVQDFGLESGEITGDCLILPNTIIPTMGDFFYVPSITEDILFKVNHVTVDTLDNGSNFYKIEYKAELIGDREKIEKQVVNTYTFVVGNVGTDFNCLLSSESSELVNKLESMLSDMSSLYQLFFDKGVQTFVYEQNGTKMYDPYLIEFLIRTKIMSYSKEYIYVHHATTTSATFDYDYTKTFFGMLEEGSLDNDRLVNQAAAIKIEDLNSLFTTRLEDYYKLDYFPKYQYITKFSVFDEDLLTKITNSEYISEGEDNYIYNLWIGYLNGDNSYVTSDMLDIMKKYDYKNDKASYYLIPINMYILIKAIESLMS